MESEIEKLMELGFPRVEAVMALEENHGDLKVAIEKLLAGEYSPPPYDTCGAAMDQVSTQNSAKSGNDEKLHGLPQKGLYPSLPPNPPPYSKVAIDTAMLKWEQSSEEFSVRYIDDLHGEEDLRCSKCFDPMKERKGPSKIVNDRLGLEVYHYECFMKSKGPKCAHCCFSLAKPDKDRELSGQFLRYEDKNYHVECYEKYAGPRCSLCFNVIIERPSGEYSGRWVQDSCKVYHEECYQKKQYSDYRARMA